MTFSKEGSHALSRDLNNIENSKGKWSIDSNDDYAEEESLKLPFLVMTDEEDDDDQRPRPLTFFYVQEIAQRPKTA